MLTFLLITLLHIHNIDYPAILHEQSPEDKQYVISQLFDSNYQPPYRINRSLPPLLKSPFGHPRINITAQSAVVIDAASGQILWQRNPDLVLPMASLTKLMTAIIFLETNPDFSKEVTIEENDNSDVEGSRLYVQPGEKMTVGDLFYTSLVGSANNATKALARSTELTEEEFIQRMNDRAKMLGLENTVFREVTGLDPENKSTALEYSRLAQYAFRHARIQEALNKDEYFFETIDKKISHRIRNTNELLTETELNLIGAKTGYLDEAGYTFVCQSEKKGLGVIVTLFKSSSSQARFSEAKELLNWAYQNYIWL